MRVVTGFLSVMILLPAVPVCAQTFPAAAIDVFNGLLSLELYDDPACTVSSGFVAPTGVFRVKRADPVDPGDGLREVAIEFVSMSLAGDGLVVVEAAGGSDADDPGDPPCTVGGAGADGGPGCSPGLLEAKQTTPDLPALMTAELFFEATVDGATLFNKSPASFGPTLFGPLEVDAVPFRQGIFLGGDMTTCVPLFDVADPLGPAVRSFVLQGVIVGSPTATAITARKLVIVDRPGGDRDRTTFLATDDEPISVFSLPTQDPEQLGLQLTVRYNADEAAFIVPPGASDGTSGWSIKFFSARFRNGAAPSGPTQVKVARVKAFNPGKLKIAARGVGDVPIDVLAAGAPVGPVRVIAHVTGGASGEAYCTEFLDCTYASLQDGAGARLVCRDGVPPASCTPFD